jgi:hypothetical protein
MDNIIFINFSNKSMIKGDHEFIINCRKLLTDYEVLIIIDAILDPWLYKISNDNIQKIVDLYFNHYKQQYCY